MTSPAPIFRFLTVLADSGGIVPFQHTILTADFSPAIQESAIGPFPTLLSTPNPLHTPGPRPVSFHDPDETDAPAIYGSLAAL